MIFSISRPFPAKFDTKISKSINTVKTRTVRPFLLELYMNYIGVLLYNYNFDYISPKYLNFTLNTILKKVIHYIYHIENYYQTRDNIFSTLYIINKKPK